MTNPDDTAFPNQDFSVGFTKREYIAIEMMKAIVTASQYYDQSWDIQAQNALHATDALIAELNKPCSTESK